MCIRYVNWFRATKQGCVVLSEVDGIGYITHHKADQWLLTRNKAMRKETQTKLAERNNGLLVLIRCVVIILCCQRVQAIIQASFLEETIVCSHNKSRVMSEDFFKKCFNPSMHVVSIYKLPVKKIGDLAPEMN